jgi:uncharacterized protein YndB with AHSA1/START domain
VTASKLEIIVDTDKPSFRTRRTFNAPRALVFEAFTKPEYLKRWMGPRGLEMVICESDLRVGGRYRFVYRGTDGQDLAFSGQYTEVVPPERISRTFVFEFMPGVESDETLVLTEKNGITTITTLTLHKSFEARDGHLEHGAEEGMTQGYERLDELLVSMQKR